MSRKWRPVLANGKCRIVCLAMILWATPAHSTGQGLADFPFWSRQAGWWRSDNTYLDGEMNYSIRAYNSLVHIEIDGATVMETEYKFYPSSPLASRIGADAIRPGEGVETISVTVSKLSDDRGSVATPSMGAGDATITTPLSPDTAVRITTNSATRFEQYRMFITLPTQATRHVANFGLISQTQSPEGIPGAVHGFSLFRGTRIAAADFAQLQAEFRLKNNVHVLVTSRSNGTRQIRRLD